MSGMVISTNFTIDDIHKIREENYEHTKNMSMEEKVAYYNGLGKKAEEEEIKKRRKLV
ncbi:hypothetical protein NXH76_19840 [Blautia schinkii]|nr:hypothetical protein [Blautia schinkii]